MQQTKAPRTESDNRAATILATALLAVFVFFVAGMAVLALVWFARFVLGG